MSLVTQQYFSKNFNFQNSGFMIFFDQSTFFCRVLPKSEQLKININMFINEGVSTFNWKVGSLKWGITLCLVPLPEEAGMNGVVDETVDELWLFEELFGDKALVPVGDPPPPDLFFVLVGSPSAKTHDRFMPAFSQAWNLQNWQFFRVFKVIAQWPPLLHL